MKAIILCGGKGKRLYPLTKNTPKILIKYKGKTVLEHIISHLKKHSIAEVILATGFLGEEIEQFVKAKKINATIVKERTPLGDAGAILNCKEYLDEDFLVYNGDLITEINLTKLINSYNKENLLTVVLKRNKIKIQEGIAELKGEKISEFKEKPILEFYTNCGIYIISSKALGFLKSGNSISKQLIPKILEQNKIGYFISESKWRDIGKDISLLREDNSEIYVA
ncbi:MAG: hypothetical protein CL943_03405 [Candidatus Diapherotrites archaeon]|uniref:Nucleotidyl transferase domain-containing protein n=1 Tax=Candidatus Iainarchaeum sp. TaxID=3101447 RepID=A0A2D6M1M6_9ARCH|nr:hypothetical protein [Candidatus Diapherotrites archaeon]|tara:strand:- start:140 stop:811 length:672 start_codon:yes stop_codon:yes gene_type:complete